METAIKFDETQVSANTTNPNLVDGRDLDRKEGKSYFKVTNIMLGKTLKVESNASNVHQFLADYAEIKKVNESPWNYNWDKMAIAINGQNLQDYHVVPEGGIVSITEGKNTSGK